MAQDTSDDLCTALGTEFFRAMTSYGGTAPNLIRKYRGVIREYDAWHHCLGFMAAATRAGVVDERCANFWLHGSELGECEGDYDY